MTPVNPHHGLAPSLSQALMHIVHHKSLLALQARSSDTCLCAPLFIPQKVGSPPPRLVAHTLPSVSRNAAVRPHRAPPSCLSVQGTCGLGRRPLFFRCDVVDELAEWETCDGLRRVGHYAHPFVELAHVGRERRRARVESS